MLQLYRNSVFICLKPFFCYLDKWDNWDRDECWSRVQMCSRALSKWCRPAGFAPWCHASWTKRSPSWTPFNPSGTICNKKWLKLNLLNCVDDVKLAYTYFGVKGERVGWSVKCRPHLWGFTGEEKSSWNPWGSHQSEIRSKRKKRSTSEPRMSVCEVNCC